MKVKTGVYVLYVSVFLAFLFLPLAIMAVTAFNDNLAISFTRWNGFTFRWFGKLFEDSAVRQSLTVSIVTASATAIFSNILGFSAALYVQTLDKTLRNVLYVILIAPMLMPGIILGVSTLILWQSLGVSGGEFLIVMAQSSFIASYAFLLFLIRLQKVQPFWLEAAKDLGATDWAIIRHIILPFLKPAFYLSFVFAFFVSFQDFNTTLFVFGTKKTLPIYIGSFGRKGITPEITALSALMIVFACTIASALEIYRRRMNKQ